MPVVGRDKEADKEYLQKTQERLKEWTKKIDEIKAKLWNTKDTPLNKRLELPFKAPIDLLFTYPGLARYHSREYIESLKKSIEGSGIIHKPQCTLDFDNLMAIKSDAGEHSNINALMFIVCGNARVQAAKELGKPFIDVNVKYLIPDEAFQLSLTENDEREELNPIDRAMLFKSWIEKTGITQTEIAKRRDKTQAWVSTTLSFLTLPTKVQEWMRERKVSYNQARKILQVKDPKAQLELAKLCVDGISEKELDAKIQAAKLKQINIIAIIPLAESEPSELGKIPPEKLPIYPNDRPIAPPMAPIAEDPLKPAKDGIEESLKKISGKENVYKQSILMLYRYTLDSCTVPCGQCPKAMGCKRIIDLFSEHPFCLKLPEVE